MVYRNGGMKMPHWRALVDSRFLNHAALDGKDCTVTIKTIKLAMVETNTGKGNKAHIYFENKEKPMLCGVTVLAAIAGMYGDDYNGWIGKRVTLYPTIIETRTGPTGTIRIRPKIPAAAKPSDRQPGSEG
jgi:hypothetical protein